MKDAIVTEKLVKQFRQVEALRGLSFALPEGAIYALVGPNGAGKTTTIKILMNILKATNGSAEVMGLACQRLRGRHFASIGYVSENQELPEWMRVETFFAFLRPFYPTWDRSLEQDLIKQLGLPLGRKLGKMSRGMRMKAALASALAFHPKLIMLDEPFTGLDPLVRDELIQSLLERAAESTIFISSHDLAEIETFASHVGYVDQGQMRFSEELATLSERFREVELTFDSPAAVPEKIPAEWLHLNASSAVIQFVDSNFKREETEALIRTIFGQVRNVSFTPMSLRSIFLAMAKAGSKHEARRPE